MLTTLPLEAFVCREVMHHYFFPQQKTLSTAWHVGLSTGLVLGAMLGSLMTCDLGAVFELIGATSACVLAYVLPPLCFVKLSTRGWKTIPAIGCIIFGCAVLVISVIQAIQDIVSGSGEKKVCV
jgi:sodium-coupled neutral amino acid transporter 11